jgi:hypothetical protein
MAVLVNPLVIWQVGKCSLAMSDLVGVENLCDCMTASEGTMCVRHCRSSSTGLCLWLCQPLSWVSHCPWCVSLFGSTPTHPTYPARWGRLAWVTIVGRPMPLLHAVVVPSPSNVKAPVTTPLPRSLRCSPFPGNSEIPGVLAAWLWLCVCVVLCSIPSVVTSSPVKI